MKTLRRVHLYLGCFFAPLLLFYVITGWYVEQYYPTQSASGYSTRLFRVFIVIMANALIATVILGIILAFRTSRNKWPVWLSLALGVTLPVILLWLGQKHD